MDEPSHRDREYCPVRQLVVSLPEQVDESSAGRVREQLLRHVDGGVRLLIADMTGVISCDHAGAEALARVYERAVTSGTQLRLVISAVAVRKVIAISGLDRLVSVFPDLAAAQSARPPAGVLRLLPGGRAARPAGLAAAPGGPRPLSWLQVISSAAAVKPASSPEQAARADRFAETLTQLTGGIFQAALTLQSAVGSPARTRAQAVEEALDLLDSTVSQARTAAFALAAPGADGPADPGPPAAVVPLGRHGPAGVPVAAVDATSLAKRLIHEARQTRAQSARRRARSQQALARSQQVRAHALRIAGLAAANRYRATAAFCQVTASAG